MECLSSTAKERELHLPSTSPSTRTIAVHLLHTNKSQASPHVALTVATDTEERPSIGDTSRVSTDKSHESASACNMTPRVEPIIAAASTYTTESMEFQTSEDPCTAAPCNKQSKEAIFCQFCDELLESLDRDDLKSVSIFLCYQFVSVFNLTETRVADYAAGMVHKSGRTVRQWRHDLIMNDGVFPESQQGSYEYSGILWKSEEINKKATKFVRSNATVKGKPNLTALSFCRWVNECLLPTSTLEPGYPRKVGLGK